LKQKNFAVLQSENRWIPSNTLEMDNPEKARSLLKLMDALEDLDDVQSVTANFEMAEELMLLVSG
jgi:transcriptional/translational regulatory protein YebC/TACO1